MNKTKKIIIIAVLFLILVVLLFLVITKTNIKNIIQPQSGEENTTAESRRELTDRDIILANNEIYHRAKKEGDALICSEMIGTKNKDICMQNIAIQKRDKLSCVNIKDDEVKKECNNRVSLEIALGNIDMNECSEIKQDDLLSSCVVSVLNVMEWKLPADKQSDNRNCVTENGVTFCQENKDLQDITSEFCAQYESRIADICREQIIFHNIKTKDDCLNLSEDNQKECLIMFK